MRIFAVIATLYFSIILVGCSSLESGVYFSLVDDISLSVVEQSGWFTETQDVSVGQRRPPVKKYIFPSGTEVVIYPVILEQRYSDGPAFLPLISCPEDWSRHEYSHILRYIYSPETPEVHIESINSVPVRKSKPSRQRDGNEMITLLELNDNFCLEDSLRVTIVCGEEKKELLFNRTYFKNFIPFTVPLF